MFLAPLCIPSGHEGRRPLPQASGRPGQPARPGPVGDPQGEDSDSQRPRDEPGGRAGAAQGAAGGGALPEPPSGPGDPRVAQRFSLRQSVVLRKPRMIRPRLRGEAYLVQTMWHSPSGHFLPACRPYCDAADPPPSLRKSDSVLFRRSQEYCADAFSSAVSLLQLERDQ